LTILTYQKMDLPDFEMTPKKTPVIHLDKNPEEILSGFNDTARNEIRKTFNLANLKCVQGAEFFADAYELYKKFEYGQGRVPFSAKEMRTFHPFVAYWRNRPISLIFCLESYPYLRARSICSARLQAKDKEIYRLIASATRRLIYEVCVYGRSKGYRWFDLGSINLTDTEKSSIAQFKSFFRGELIDEYTYFRKSRFFKILEKFVKIKLIIYKIFKI